ncbi:4-hydroxy-tetrahydrodipicolinate synthase [Aquirhabdus parva]|uniref:4-hydroxy-tetrahydrodipicolinate synthase n=1 Tax=Aquirhabdus parva TaxID=2283318 RepID=A0A345P3Q1_9GAMM|nr:4-hydroxy-tetrahydrodipicolinate synthase [Aquirhabdus parva]AXI01910.1 4-hydroxy-tetrahydrodipicolinate synthase [Aquirhabdus parva]
MTALINRFQGIWIPLVTPFHGQDNRLDLEAVKKLVIHLINQGIDGLIVGATTGESATLTHAEHNELLKVVLDTVKDQVPVMVGISGSDTVEVAKNIKHYSNHFEISGFLMSAPAYVRPSQQGIIHHFEAAAAATDLPIAIYNIPYRTGVNIELATLQHLSRNPQFVAVKESGNGDISQLNDQISHTSLNILSGEDSIIFVCSCLGGQGAISAAAHIRPDLYKKMHELIGEGNLVKARQINDALQPFIHLLFSEPNPAPVKAALSIMGLIQDNVRLPMTVASPELKAKLDVALAKILAFNID